MTQRIRSSMAHEVVAGMQRLSMRICGMRGHIKEVSGDYHEIKEKIVAQ